MLVEAGVILFLTYWLMSEYTHNIFFRSYADQILLDPMTGYVALLVMGVGLTASTAVVLLYRLLRNAKRPLETTSMPRIRGGVEKMIPALVPGGTFKLAFPSIEGTSTSPPIAAFGKLILVS